MSEQKRMVRSRTNRMLCGVCGGLAEYFNVDPALIRLIFVGMTLLHGSGLLIYVLLCIVMPEETVTAPVTPRSNGNKTAHATEFEPLGSRDR